MNAQAGWFGSQGFYDRRYWWGLILIAGALDAALVFIVAASHHEPALQGQLSPGAAVLPGLLDLHGALPAWVEAFDLRRYSADPSSWATAPQSMLLHAALACGLSTAMLLALLVALSWALLGPWRKKERFARQQWWRRFGASRAKPLALQSDRAGESADVLEPLLAALRAKPLDRGELLAAREPAMDRLAGGSLEPRLWSAVGRATLAAELLAAATPRAEALALGQRCLEYAWGLGADDGDTALWLLRARLRLIPMPERPSLCFLDPADKAEPAPALLLAALARDRKYSLDQLAFEKVLAAGAELGPDLERGLELHAGEAAARSSLEALLRVFPGDKPLLAAALADAEREGDLLRSQSYGSDLRSAPSGPSGGGWLHGASPHARDEERRFLPAWAAALIALLLFGPLLGGAWRDAAHGASLRGLWQPVAKLRADGRLLPVGALPLQCKILDPAEAKALYNAYWRLKHFGAVAPSLSLGADHVANASLGPLRQVLRWEWAGGALRLLTPEGRLVFSGHFSPEGLVLCSAQERTGFLYRQGGEALPQDWTRLVEPENYLRVGDWCFLQDEQGLWWAGYNALESGTYELDPLSDSSSMLAGAPKDPENVDHRVAEDIFSGPGPIVAIYSREEAVGYSNGAGWSYGYRVSTIEPPALRPRPEVLRDSQLKLLPGANAALVAVGWEDQAHALEELGLSDARINEDARINNQERRRAQILAEKASAL